MSDAVLRAELARVAAALGGLPRVGAIPTGEDEREVGREVAVAGVARAFEHELDAVGAEPRGGPREFGAEGVAHSLLAFPSVRREAADLGSGFTGAALSGLLPPSDLDSDAGFSDSGLRGPLPSLP